MNNTAKTTATQTGFSLVELMIALTLGLLLTAAIGALFYANKKNYNQNNLIAEMQDNARFAIQALSRDLEMAGFLGGMVDMAQLKTDSPTLPSLGQDCGPGSDGVAGWAFDRAAVEFLNDVTPGNVAGTYGCLAASEILARTDILAVRRVSGRATATIDSAATSPGLAPNVFYLRTNRTVGSLFFSAASAVNPDSGHPPNVPPMSFWEYYSRLYFVRPYAVTPGDDIPTLCRAFLSDQAAPTVATECLAEGVEDMQIAFGIDTDGDGVVNRYQPDPTAAEVAQAVTARVQLLMRSATRDFSYTNNKTYDLMGKDDDQDGVVDESGFNPEEIDGYRPQDNYYRRLVETTVILRNPTLALGIAP